MTFGVLLSNTVRYSPGGGLTRSAISLGFGSAKLLICSAVRILSSFAINSLSISSSFLTLILRHPQRVAAVAGDRLEAAWWSTRSGRPARNGLERVGEFPDGFLFRSHFKDDADRARVDQRVSVRKALGSRNEPRIEVLLVGRGVAPERLGRAKRAAFRADVIAVLVGWRNKLVDRGIFLGLATAAVIEDEQVAFAAQSLGDPLDVVLTEEALIEAGAVAVGLGLPQR